MAGVAEEIVVSESDYRFPVEDLLTGRGAIFGKSGSGKSNSMTVIVEELLEQSLPLLIVDQDGEYHGLKEEYDILHVGADAECDRTIGVDDAEHIADRALEDNQPVILDVSGYMEEETARELVHTVVRRLFSRENEVQKPFLLIVEEIHEYIPERGGLDDLGEMLVRVAKRGRKRGLGLCGISQRPASVDKDFITQCDWIVWHRLTWQNDTKVVGRILGSDYAERVQELGDGEGYVMTDWAEEVRRVRFRLKRTLDAGATPGLEIFQTDGSPPDEETAESPDSVSFSSETELYTGDEGDATEIDTADQNERSSSSIDGGPAPTNGSGGTAAETSGVDQAPYENPIMELGQMFAYIFGTIVYRLLRGLRRLTPRLDSRGSKVEPFARRANLIDWRRMSLLMVLISLLLLATIGYLLLYSGG